MAFFLAFPRWIVKINGFPFVSFSPSLVRHRTFLWTPGPFRPSRTQSYCSFYPQWLTYFVLFVFCACASDITYSLFSPSLFFSVSCPPTCFAALYELPCLDLVPLHIYSSPPIQSNRGFRWSLARVTLSESRFNRYRITQPDTRANAVSLFPLDRHIQSTGPAHFRLVRWPIVRESQ